MQKNDKKSKITMEKLARITQNEFSAVRKEMADEFSAVRKEMADEFSAVRKEMADEFSTAREYMFKHFATKMELRDMKDDIIDEVRKENLKILQSNDKVVTKLDLLIKDNAAHDALHKRIEDNLYNHDRRIKKLEATVKSSD